MSTPAQRTSHESSFPLTKANMIFSSSLKLTSELPLIPLFVFRRRLIFSILSSLYNVSATHNNLSSSKFPLEP